MVRCDYSKSRSFIPVAWYSVVTNSDAKPLQVFVREMIRLKPMVAETRRLVEPGPSRAGNVCDGHCYSLECEFDLDGHSWTVFRSDRPSDIADKIEACIAECLRQTLPRQFPIQMAVSPADQHDLPLDAIVDPARSVE